MSIQDTMGKMVGPLPLGAWVALVGVAGGYGYYRSRNPSAAPEPVESTIGDPAVGTGGVGGGNWIDLEPGENTAINTKPVDNDQWANNAMVWFQSNNYDMAVAGQAVGNYLGGTLKTADVRGWAMIRTVMMNIGAPPYGVTQDESVPNAPVVPIKTPVKPVPKPVIKPKPVPKPVPKPKPAAPKPKPKPKPTPAKKRYHTVRSGETLTSIGRKYRVSWQSIYNANRSKISNPNRIYPGWKLLIPNS